MRINELTPFKTNALYTTSKSITNDDFGDSYEKFATELKAAGFKKLGAGIKAIVYEHPQLPYVIKVFNNDPKYFKYFNWARENQDNPHVPQIRGKYIKINERLYAVRMEKLIPVTRDYEFIRKYIDPKIPVVDPQSIFLATMILSPKNSEFLENNYPKMVEVKSFIHSVVKVGADDLHNGNVMKRSDGTLVVTDPLV